MTIQIVKASVGQSVFTSDTHFGHANIIKYSERPFTFPDIFVMDSLMLQHMKEADDAGKIIFHCGDFVFNPKTLLETSWRPTGKHYIILGNHDKNADQKGKYRKLYREFFTNIVGESKTWRNNSLLLQLDNIRLLLSHEPQKRFDWAQYNIYGHHHNNMYRNPQMFIDDYDWIFNNDKYLNAGVDLTNFKPVSFDELLLIPKPQKIK